MACSMPHATFIWINFAVLTDLKNRLSILIKSIKNTSNYVEKKMLNLLQQEKNLLQEQKNNLQKVQWGAVKLRAGKEEGSKCGNVYSWYICTILVDSVCACVTALMQ